MYLIMKCEELCDGWECDANRIPLAVVADWKDWIQRNPVHTYEVYQIVGESLELIKGYHQNLEDGMALYWWGKDENPEEVSPTVIRKYPNYTRNNILLPSIEKIIKKAKRDGENFDDSLSNCGYIAWTMNDNYYVYGEYSDNHYTLGY